jgi:hypothetical protein
MDKDMIWRSLLIIFAAGVLYFLVSQYQSKQSTRSAEKFYEDTIEEMSMPSAKELPYLGEEVSKGATGVANTVVPSEAEDNSEFRTVDYATKKVSSDCFPKDRLTAEDLLPADAANSKWAQVNPAGQGDLSDQNFLTAGFQIGVNTVGSSLRNANLQLRSEPPISKKKSWGIHESTIEPDLLRRPLEIDGSW